MRSSCSPATPNRLPAAEALFNGGLAPTLVVSADRSGHDEQRAALCREAA